MFPNLRINGMVLLAGARAGGPPDDLDGGGVLLCHGQVLDGHGGVGGAAGGGVGREEAGRPVQPHAALCLERVVPLQQRLALHPEHEKKHINVDFVLPFSRPLDDESVH